jgi:hypothetical protein
MPKQHSGSFSRVVHESTARESCDIPAPPHKAGRRENLAASPERKGALRLHWGTCECCKA